MTSVDGITLYGGSTSRTTGGRVFQVTNIVMHPEYNPDTFDCDVSVLRVSWYKLFLAWLGSNVGHWYTLSHTACCNYSGSQSNQLCNNVVECSSNRYHDLRRSERS
ncbi:hypothetical protein AND_009298 [Anopheles darlingi]|uniref:Peptidase S1 domain-containing protein n=1 Tax=Anopheles darlingi TaxID=43151 RepID=W5J8F9_ANODA|nr:hypothetical protein AND_009298 [Anopheles darlingi]